jgi:hypothetical protein
MGIEILIVQLGVHLAQKVGEKWIDRIATGIADIPEQAFQLLRQAVSDPTKQQDVEDYFRDHPDVAERLGENIATTLQSDDIVASLAATVVPPVGAKVGYYAELIRWIVQSGANLGRTVVLKGFLNGELCLSYFEFDKNNPPHDPLAVALDSHRIRFVESSPLKIYVGKMDSAEKRDENFEMLNQKIERNQRKKLSRFDYSNFRQIAEVHEDYVLYTDRGTWFTLRDFPELSPEDQREQEIDTTYRPIALMIRSLGEMLEDRNKDVEILITTILNASR